MKSLDLRILEFLYVVLENCQVQLFLRHSRIVKTFLYVIEEAAKFSEYMGGEKY